MFGGVRTEVENNTCNILSGDEFFRGVFINQVLMFCFGVGEVPFFHFCLNLTFDDGRFDRAWANGVACYGGFRRLQRHNFGQAEDTMFGGRIGAFMNGSDITVNG